MGESEDIPEERAEGQPGEGPEEQPETMPEGQPEQQPEEQPAEQPEEEPEEEQTTEAPAEEGKNVKDGLYYAKTDEWVQIEGTTGTVGITDYAQHTLGDIVDLELPEANAQLSAGQRAGAIESVKAVADIHSPVSGTVTETNSDLPDNLDSLKGDAYSAWMFKVQLSNPDEVKGLMDAAAYRQYLETRTGH